MATHNKTNRTQHQTDDQRLIDGLTKHTTTISSLVIGEGTSFSTADIIAILQARIDIAHDATSTRATWQAAVQADHNERAKTKAFVAGLRQVLHVAFAGSIDALADFGLTPRKAPVTTPEQRIVAVAKAKATRAARHTMGKKQRAAIKGTVVPQTAPEAPPTPTAEPAVPTMLALAREPA